MWTILAERPFLISIMIGVFVAGLLYAWLQTGDKRLALSAFLVSLLIPGSYFIAESIETDREKILRAIYSTAAAVEQNDHETAVLFIGDRATRQRALTELPKYDFQRVRVRNLRITSVAGSDPEEVSVDLDASVTASMARGSMKNVRIPRRVILTFQKQPDESWLMTDYTHLPLTGGADGFTPNRI